jgi:hypothetical protein
MMPLLLWRIGWLTMAAGCLYLLSCRWQWSLVTLTPIDPLVTTRVLMAEDKYAEAADQVHYFLDIAEDHERNELEALAAEINSHRSSMSYQTHKIVQEGLLTGSSDEVSGQIAGLASSLLVIGDFRDLVKEGLHWLQNEPTDEVIIALSTLGMVASASQFITWGSTSPVKTGLSLATMAHKLGTLPPWLSTHLIKMTHQVLVTRSSVPIMPIMQRIQTLMDQAGWRQALTLLPHTRDPGSLNRLATLARHCGPATAPLVRLGGDAALASAPHVEKLGIANLKLASRYGPEGIHALQVIGPVRFMKYASRLAKLAYNYPWLATLARALLAVPTYLWVIGAIVGIVLARPWPRSKDRIKPLPHWIVTQGGR